MLVNQSFGFVNFQDIKKYWKKKCRVFASNFYLTANKKTRFAFWNAAYDNEANEIAVLVK